jgi:hypothetical protein
LIESHSEFKRPVPVERSSLPRPTDAREAH